MLPYPLSSPNHPSPNPRYSPSSDNVAASSTPASGNALPSATDHCHLEEQWRQPCTEPFRYPSGKGSIEETAVSLDSSKDETPSLDTLASHLLPAVPDVVSEPECSVSVTTWAPSILLTNPQSLTNCFSDFVELVTTHDPDVVVVSETWFSESKPAGNFQLEGYMQFHDDREHGRRGGGVAVYAKTHVFVASPSGNEDRIVFVNPHSPQIKVAPELECLWVCVGENTFICGLYHSPSAPTGKLLFDHIVNASLDLRSRHGKENMRIVVAGDFNHLSCDRLNACLGVRNLVQEPTHENSTIDLILTDTPQHYCIPQLLPPVHRSKHSCVLLKPNNTAAAASTPQ